jgi:hypothetical protein
VRELGLGDLEACARRVAIWRRAHLAVPLIVVADEFERSLDAFPAGSARSCRDIACCTVRIHSTASLWIRSTSGAPAKWKRAGTCCTCVRASSSAAGTREGVAARGRLGAGAARPAGEPDSPRRHARDDAVGLRNSETGPLHGRTIASVLATLDAPLAVTDAARGFPSTRRHRGAGRLRRSLDGVSVRRIILIGVCLAALVTPSRSHAQPPPPS